MAYVEWIVGIIVAMLKEEVGEMPLASSVSAPTLAEEHALCLTTLPCSYLYAT